MNTTEARANALAQKIEEATKLANKVNARGYNWLPLVKFLNDYDEPQNIARDLRSIYYDFVNYMIRSCECGCNATADSLYVLRSIMEAIEEMQNPNEDRVMGIGVVHGLLLNPENTKR